MLYFIVKSALSGIIIALVSEMARRQPTLGALVASLPLVSILGMIWLWHDTHDPARMATHVGATFWLVLPSLPMFFLMPYLLRHGMAFGWALCAGIVLTMMSYAAMLWLMPKFGYHL